MKPTPITFARTNYFNALGFEGHIEKLMEAKKVDAEKKKEYQTILNQVDLSLQR